MMPDKIAGLRCIIYPEHKYKGYWDLFMTLILVITCILTPYNIAFYSGNEPPGLKYTILSIDILFLLDIVIIFNTVIYNEEMEMITSRKAIAKNYLTGWFSVDLLAILPFDIILATGSDFN